jgi:RNA polymerase-associated protein LEO1
MSDSEDPINLPDEAGDDLFGDGDDNNLDEVLSQSPKSDRGRALSDGDLASDRGRGYGDDLPEDRDDQEQTREQVVMTVPMYRHRIPKSKGNQVCLVPSHFYLANY